MLLSTPALVLSFWFDWQPVPGVPASAMISVLCPVCAALLLSYMERRRPGTIALLRRGIDLGRLPSSAWLAGLLILHPVLLGLQYAILSTVGVTLPPLAVSPLQIIMLFGLFLIPAWGEESGWTGYATDPLRQSLGPVLAALVLGVIQALWHLGPLLAVGRDYAWIAWWMLGAIASRFLFLWLYLRGGRSLAGAILFHAMSNVAWQVFPISGSHYDPMIGSLLICALAGPAAIDLARRPVRPALP